MTATERQMLHAELARLEREVERLAADHARVDWLSAQSDAAIDVSPVLPDGPGDPGVRFRVVWREVGAGFHRSVEAADLRAALDKARDETR
jgi:hypothetical protein